MLTLIAPATSATLFLIATLVWQQPRLPGRRDLALCLGVGAVYFLYHADPPRFSILLPLLFLGPLACNRAVRSGFEVGGRAPWIEGAAAILLLALGGLGYWARQWPWSAQGFNVLSLLLFLELPILVWRGIADDLVAARRTARLSVLAASGGLGLIIAIGSIMGEAQLAVTVGGLVTLGLGFLTVGLGPKLLEPDRDSPPVAPHSGKSGLDPRETLILRRLEGVMDSEALYRDPNLTLSRLAHRLDVPEHRLRRVIHLGTRHKNFSHYVHGFRLSDFKALIDDPKQDGETILSLSLSVGYSSLSAFNRAFKAEEGMTPREYRMARMQARTANTKASPAKTADAPSATNAA